MFDIIRVFGLLVACSIGFYRLVKNNLLDHEIPMYWLTSLTCLYFLVIFLLETGTLLTEEIINNLIRVGWLPLVACLISLQLYYRQFDLRE